MKTGWVEIELGRWFGKIFPWWLKVERLPGGGTVTQCGIWHEQAANDSRMIELDGSSS